MLSIFRCADHLGVGWIIIHAIDWAATVKVAPTTSSWRDLAGGAGHRSSLCGFINDIQARRRRRTGCGSSQRARDSSVSFRAWPPQTPRFR